MKRLNQFRARIDSIDAEILRLLSRRARIAIQVGQLKRSSGLPYYSPERERDILTRLMQMNP
jgi:chorismate mutase